MPWHQVEPMHERRAFIQDVLNGQKMAAACRVRRISRKTGYKWWRRFKEGGIPALASQPPVARILPHRTPVAIEQQIIQARRQHVSWGPRKLRAFLERQRPRTVWPAPSTIGDIIDRAGLIQRDRRKRRLIDIPASPLSDPTEPNGLWCADFKGEFKLGNGAYCYPLTVTDSFSRFLLGCHACPGTRLADARAVFERLFREYGMPGAIRTDNGTPFASRGIGRLSQLAVWWLKLGIRLERIALGRPEQNGRHERMHRTLKADTTRPPQANQVLQQRRFDAFRDEFNNVRPHEALENGVPIERYRPSRRAYPTRLLTPEYPGHYEIRRIGIHGAMKWRGIDVFVSHALAGDHVGLVEIDEDLWDLYFGKLHLARWNDHTKCLTGFGMSRACVT